MTQTATREKQTGGAQARVQYRGRWQTAAECGLLLVAAVVILEGFLNLCGVGRQEFLMPDAQIGCRHIPGQLVTWRLEGYSNDRLNSQGLRDVEHEIVKPPAVKRIALLGDSSTEGLQVPLERTYARVLESSLKSAGRFEVLNFATSSYSTGQQLLQFRSEVSQYKPDLTVLLYNRGDSIENVRDPRQKSAEPRPYFYLGADGALARDDSVLDARKDQMRQSRLLAFLQRNSRIYGVFTQSDLALSINEKLYRKLRGWLTSLASAVAGKQAAGGARPSYGKQDGWLVTRELIKELNHDCRLQKSRFVVVAFPNTLNDPEFAQQIAGLAELSRQEGFAFCDLTGRFKAHADPNRLFLLFHFSAEGHRLVADEIERFLKSQRLL